jgi:hypothetical protein
MKITAFCLRRLSTLTAPGVMAQQPTHVDLLRAVTAEATATGGMAFSTR